VSISVPQRPRGQADWTRYSSRDPSVRAPDLQQAHGARKRHAALAAGRLVLRREGQLQGRGRTGEQTARLEVAHDRSYAAMLGHGHHISQRNALASGFGRVAGAQAMGAQSPDKPANPVRRLTIRATWSALSARWPTQLPRCNRRKSGPEVIWLWSSQAWSAAAASPRRGFSRLRCCPGDTARYSGPAGEDLRPSDRPAPSAAGRRHSSPAAGARNRGSRVGHRYRWPAWTPRALRPRRFSCVPWCRRGPAPCALSSSALSALELVGLVQP